MTLKKEIEDALNRHSAENGSDTPDFILATYLMQCLEAYNSATMAREAWYGREPKEVEPPENAPEMIQKWSVPEI